MTEAYACLPGCELDMGKERLRGGFAGEQLTAAGVPGEAGRLNINCEHRHANYPAALFVTRHSIIIPNINQWLKHQVLVALAFRNCPPLRMIHRSARHSQPSPRPIIAITHPREATQHISNGVARSVVA